MSEQNAIEVRNLSKQFKVEYDKAKTLKERLVFWRSGNYEVHQVLKDVNLDIKRGETVALVGVNGSGKSTLLKLMTKIIFPNKGTLKTNGKLTSLLELGAGFHPDFTGRENIYFNASIFGLTRKEIEKRVDQIIEFSELGHFIDNPIRTYSSGMYMRLAFSVAINVDADILLIDEILAVGDQHFQDKCYAKLEELRDSGKTIVIVTHNLGVVKELCHRAIWIYNGEVKLDGDPTYVIDEYLKQVALDHKEKIQKQVDAGEYKKKGVVYIDLPKAFSESSLNLDVLKCGGWTVSNDDKAHLVMYIDDKEIHPEIHSFSRPDVFEVYYEEYGGNLSTDNIGWDVYLDPKEIGVGQHVFKVTCNGEEGVIYDEKEVTFTIV